MIERKYWAVGNYHISPGIYQTLIEHWNGSNWGVVSSPSIGTLYSQLEGVVAVSASDVWAVGYYGKDINHATINQTLVEHWDGRTWNIVSSPNIGTNDNILSSVAFDSANDVWAVGTYANNTGSFQTLTEHWNGSNWSVVSSPNARLSDFLEEVIAVSVNNIWAVVYDGTVNKSQTLIEHYS